MLDGASQASGVIKVQGGSPGLSAVLPAVAQEGIHRRRVEQLGGVQNIIWVSGAFDGAHGFGDFRAVGFFDPLARHDAIAVLAAHRAAEAEHQSQHALTDAPQGAHTLALLQIQNRADVQTASRGMGIDSALGMMVSQNLFDLAHEVAKAFHGHRAILDEGCGAGRLRTRIQNPQTHLADVPNAGLIFGRLGNQQEIADALD